jgi:subfamily B ATP-binding cassette protein MsbA
VDQSLVSSLHQFAAALAVLVMVYVALGWSAMSLGAVGVFLFAMLRLAPNVSNLQGELYYLDGELPHLIETLREQEELKTKRTDYSGKQPAPSPINTIELNDVCFQYSEDEGGLSKASLHATRGEFVAIVGESGAGKSTVVSLLSRLYDPDKGRILADGVPLEDIDIEEWRQRIAVVRQDPYIFDDTLRNNILAGCADVDDERLEQVCVDARIDEFVHTLPQGYETRLGDEGVRLSGGQKQRVAIARALIRNPEVLILDEATSNLDTTLEREILQTVQSTTQERIVFVITHRLGSVTDADRIYTIEDGEIVESGRHCELVESDGAYASLYSTESSIISSTR